MNAKTTMIPLKCDALGGVVRDFEYSHAERLLRMKDNGGWVLASNDYEFINGNIIRRHSEEAPGKQKRRNRK